MTYFDSFKKQNREQFDNMTKEQEERSEKMINTFGAFMSAFWGMNDGGYNDSVDRKDIENV